MVGLQGVQGILQTDRQALQLGLFLLGEVVQVHIIGTPAVFMRIDLVLDTVQTGHQDGGIAEIGVTGSIGVTQLEPALFRGLGIGRDTDDSAAVGGGIAHGDRSLKTGHQPLEGVGAGVGERAQGRNVLQQAAHEPVGLAAQMGVAVVVGEHRLTILQQQHMHVHAAAGLAVDGLGHKGGALTVLEGGVVDDVLDHHGGIGHLHHLAQLRLDLKLAGSGHLGMMVIDVNAGIQHMHHHLGTALIGHVKGLCDVVVFLLGNYRTLTLGGAVPIGLLCVHKGRNAVGLYLPAHLIKEIELELRQDEHGVGNAAVFHILVGGQHDVAGVLSQRSVFRVIDDHGIARHGQGGDLTEGVDHRGVGVGDEHHVTFFHHGVAVVGCIKTDAVLHGLLGKVSGRDGHMAVLAIDVHHLEVHHLDVLFADELHDFLYSFCHKKDSFPEVKYPQYVMLPSITGPFAPVAAGRLPGRRFMVS